MAGLAIPAMANARMGLSTHLEGVINGIFLVVLGLIWHRLALSDKWLAVTYWLTIYGAFANFIAVLIGINRSLGEMMPLAGGQEGAPALEVIISFLLISLSLAMLLVRVLILKGLFNNINPEQKMKIIK